MCETPMATRDMAKFFNDNYHAGFKDISFHKPTSETARKVFNILMTEVIILKIEIDVKHFQMQHIQFQFHH